MKVLLTLASVTILGATLQGQRPATTVHDSLAVRRLAAVHVQGLPESGYFVIDGPEAWRRLRDA